MHPQSLAIYSVYGRYFTFGDVVTDDALLFEYKEFGALKGWRLGADKEVAIIWLGYADDFDDCVGESGRSAAGNDTSG